MAPVPAPQPASTYDPYQNERYDLYQRDQYSDYYLWDDFWLGDDYYYHEQYYHDDRNPHLYYDNYYGNESPQPICEPPSHHYAETAAASYGLLEYIDHHYEVPHHPEGGREYAGEPASAAHSEHVAASSEQTSQPSWSYGPSALPPSSDPFVQRDEGYSYSEAASVILGPEQMSGRNDIPLISPAYSEASYIPSERSIAPETASTAAVLYSEPQAVLPSYQHIAEPNSTGLPEHVIPPQMSERYDLPLISEPVPTVLTPHPDAQTTLPNYSYIAEAGQAASYYEHVIPQEISVAAESATKPDLAMHSPEVLLPPLQCVDMPATATNFPEVLAAPLYQAELYSSEARSSESQPFAGSPMVAEVVAPSAVQHAQEALHAVETQHSQGFATPSDLPVQGDNSSLVYFSLPYVNNAENAVFQEASLALQPEHLAVSNAGEVAIWGRTPNYHENQALVNESLAAGNLGYDPILPPVSQELLHAADLPSHSGFESYPHFEVASHVVEAPLITSAATASSLLDGESRLLVNRIEASGAAESAVVPEIAHLLANAENSMVTPLVQREDARLAADTILTSPALLDNVNMMNELLSPQVKHTFTQIVDNPSMVENSLHVTANCRSAGAQAAVSEPFAASGVTGAAALAESSSLVRDANGVFGHEGISERNAKSAFDHGHAQGQLLQPAEPLNHVECANKPDLLAHSEARGFRVLDESGQPLAFEVLIPQADAGALPADARDADVLVRDGKANPLVMEEAIAASVFSGKVSEGELDPRSADSKGKSSQSSGSQKGEVGKGTSPASHTARTIAGAVALGGARVAGKAAKEVLGLTGFAAEQLLREDEDLNRIAQADDIVHDGIAAMRSVGNEGHESLVDRLIKGEIASDVHPATDPEQAAAAKAARGKHAAAKQPTLREKAEAVNAKDLLVATREAEISLISDSLTGAEQVSASLREAANGGGLNSVEGILSTEAPDGKVLPTTRFSKRGAALQHDERLEGMLVGPASASGQVKIADKPAAVGKVASARGAGERDLDGFFSPKQSALVSEKGGSAKDLVAGKEKGSSGMGKGDPGAEGDLDPKNTKDGKGKDKKKPRTERERDLEKKEAKRKAARKDGRGDKKALSVVSVGKNAGLKSALLVGGMAKSGAKKLVSERNEELAVAITAVDKTKKTVNVARKIVHAPAFLLQQARRAISLVVNSVKAVFHTAATLTAMGPVGGFIALFAFILFIVIIAVLLGTASIINDEQEVSEVSALVAELDAQLTEEINALGHQPILYLDASDTYNAKENDGKALTKDTDLSDEKSDLKEVVASSVTVRTDPAEVAAYIDAKYTGNWQVGAASWKYTIEAFGETWNLIEWENMPEWAWKALNKVKRGDFEKTMTEELTDLLVGEFGLKESVAEDVANDTADEFADVIYDNQIQGMNEEVIMQIIEDSVKAHRGDLDLDKDDMRKLYYEMQDIITGLIGEEDPFAFVYDEIVLLHERLNWWSNEYGSFGFATSPGAGSPFSLHGKGHGTMNAYGYPNSYGYDEEEIGNWDGFNEVSVYGISEAGTTSITADGTRITNTWADMTMGIACEGLQNSVFAYWTSAYREATGTSGSEPVKITLYNPSTGKSITAEVIDCGGWRGFNERYAGKNLDRQWDLLPAVWKALGGSEEAGTMRVYWKVDPDAVVGQAALQPKTFEDYPWPKESDAGNDEITLTRPTLIVHNVQDALNNNPLMAEIIDRDTFRTAAEFEAVKSFVVLKVKEVMKGLLTMENGDGDTYVDYNYLRRDLGAPFGEDKSGNPREWVITHRYNPGYEDFELDDAYVEVEPLGDVKTVYAIMEGEVEKIEDGEVTVRSYIDTANSAKVTYLTLKDIKVEEGDEIKKGQKLGTMKGGSLRVKWYEVNDAALQIETEKDWAYDVGLYMAGFAGYEEPDEPQEYVDMGGDWSGCTTVVEFARSRLGCPYVWGATGPDTFDCSGLTQWCYAQAGISIPRNSEAQYVGGKKIPMSEVQPGDILWKPGHVGIYIGNNMYIHAPHAGDVVKISGNAKSYFVAAVSYR